MIGKRRSRSRALSAAFLVLSFSELAAQNPSTITSVTKGSNSPIIPGNSNHVTYNDNRSTYKNIRNTYNIYTSSTGHSESSQTDQKLKDSDKLAGARRMAEDGKYLDAISEFKKAANSGDSDAMVEVGRIYLAGKGGILKNREEARVWFAKASDQGNAAGMDGLGRLLCDDPHPDFVRAKKLFEDARAKNNSDAEIDLGLMYEDGEGVQADILKAREFYMRAEKAGNQDAYFRLAQTHLESDPPDDAEAKSWFEKGVEKKDARSMAGMGMLCVPKAKPGDWTCSRSWFERAASSGSSWGYVMLGLLDLDPTVGPIDLARALKRANRAIELDENVTAIWIKAEIYRLGLGGVTKDIPQAIALYQKAAQGRSQLAMNSLGVIYINGDGVSKDAAIALRWLRASAEDGNSDAMRILGDLFFDGNGVSKDVDQAIVWYTKSAGAGNVTSMESLGYIYIDGRETPKDISRGLYWYEQAAAKQDTEAILRLFWEYSSGANVTKDEARALKYCQQGSELGDVRAGVSDWAWV